MRLEEAIKTAKFQSEVHKAHLNILFTAGWLRARISASIKPLGISMEQFNVLRIVRGQHQRGIRVKDITRRMLEKNSNTTRIIDRLEQKGLLRRLTSDQDRRERAIVLTPAGETLLADIDLAWQQNNPHTAPLTPDEARMLNELLDKMRE